MQTPSALRRAMRTRRASSIILWVAALGLLLGPLARGSPPAAPPTATATDPDQLAWDLFVAINRSQGLATSGDAKPADWETWPNTQDIYRADGADPGPGHARRLGTGATLSGFAKEARFEDGAHASPELMALTNVRHIVGGRMVPGVPGGINEQRLIESRMNRIAYDYLRSHGLYNLEGQIRAVESGRPVDFPRGSIEVKASWRPIEAVDAPRYRTLKVRLGGGETRLYGLTGLNLAAKVLAKTPSQPAQRGSHWLWASFEHVDNAHRVGGEGWQLPSRDAYACPEGPGNCDRVPAGIGLETTVWQNYRLRGTLTDYVDAEGRPLRLGNSELESGLQSTSSCMTCHARAALAVAGGRPRRLPVFATNERRGSIGLPDSNWYRADGVEYRSLDFVWSLSQAKPRRAAVLAIPDRPELPVQNLGDTR